MQFPHLRVKVNLLIAVAELNIFTGHEAATFMLNFITSGGITEFWDIRIGLFKTLLLPIVEGAGDGIARVLVQLHIFLLERHAHLPQVHKEDFVLAVAIMDFLAVLHCHMRLLVVVQDPQRHADVGGIEHVAGQDDDGFHLVVRNEFAANGQLGSIRTQSTVGKQETRYAIGEEINNESLILKLSLFKNNKSQNIFTNGFLTNIKRAATS